MALSNTAFFRRWPRRRVILWVAVLFSSWWAIGLIGALQLTAPRPYAIEPLQQLGRYAIEDVATTTADGVAVRAWLVRCTPTSARCVVLAAGIGGCRLSMLDRGQWYIARGWSVLLVDLRGTGVSAPARIAMGWNEALDLAAWHQCALERGFSQIAVHGQSLAAAAAIYSVIRGETAPAWHFVVLESCYRDARAALTARLPWLPSLLLWPLVASCEWLIGADVDELTPQRAIAALQAPTFMASGEEDAKLGPAAADALFHACGARQKERCDIPGAGHIDLWSEADGLLPQRLALFLAAR